MAERLEVHAPIPASPVDDLRPRVLLLCPKAATCRDASEWFSRLGFECAPHADVRTAVKEVATTPPDLVVAPWAMVDHRGNRAIEVVTALADGSSIPAIALVKGGKEASAALDAGVADIARRKPEWRIVASRALRIVEAKRLEYRARRLEEQHERQQEKIRNIQRQKSRSHLRDELTGLPTRAAFANTVKSALSAGMSRRRRLAVMMFDIDRFRYVNHTVGRHRANMILQEVAQRLTDTLRSREMPVSDTAGSAISMVARLGGDQFGVLLGSLADDVDPVRIIELFRTQLIRNFSFPDAEEIHITTSTGVAIAPDDGTTVEELLQNAEFASGESAELGGGAIRFYGSSESQRSPRVARMTTLLTGALARNEFALRYQPIVDARTARVNAAEVLLRWSSPELGSVSPGEFIPLAEERGLMTEVGTWVLDQACAQLRAWSDDGLPKIRMAVNVSISQLIQEKFSDVVESVLRERGVDPTLLELEISERGTLRDEPAVMKQLHTIRDLGCRLAIDDFGTGNSAVAYLKRFPITTLKIDRSFVSGVTNSDEDAVITRTIAAMATNLGFGIVAEGVEEEAQRQFLVDCECDELQGFLFSPAVEERRFRDLLRDSALGTDRVES